MNKDYELPDTETEDEISLRRNQQEFDNYYRREKYEEVDLATLKTKENKLFEEFFKLLKTVTMNRIK